MCNRHSEETIKSIIDQYFNGKSVALICVEHGVPRSTVYSWIKQYRKLQSSNNAEVSYQDYYNLKRKYP